ncbi:CoA-transferase family III [Xylaria sp. CBS 124048]|nr:CoA-transferase family III [Xylaria sp. CBS 124048]
MMDRSAFTPYDMVKELWTHLELPPTALSSLSLPGLTPTWDNMRSVIPSSFKIGHLAQSTIALSALGAAVAHAALRTSHAKEIPRTAVPLRHAVLEFQCERLYTLAGAQPAETWGPIGGLHGTADGYVRIHDAFPHHRGGALALLGLAATCTERREVSARTRQWGKEALEEKAGEMGLPIYALREAGEWDALPQGREGEGFPVGIRWVGGGTLLRPRPNRYEGLGRREGGERRCLDGLRVLEFSRVIAAPVAGKTLAAHGADVLWVTSPRLPDLPPLDREFARGKRSIQLDLDVEADKAKLLELVRDADVVIQGYRPGSLAGKGLSPEELAKVNPGIIVANLSAFGPGGVWGERRGFDSLVQTCGGINVAEAERYGKDGGEASVARPLPCQALDHGAGYLLAAGISAAVWRRERDREEGKGGGVGGVRGAYVVEVSLVGVMKYLRSLGQFEGRSGFEGEDCTILGTDEEEKEYFETRQTVFGEMRFLKHSAHVEGLEPGWDRMPTPLGSEEAVWVS